MQSITTSAPAATGQDAYDRVPLSTRQAVIARIRETLAANYKVLSELAVSETGLGRVEDKIQKNRLVLVEEAAQWNLVSLFIGEHQVEIHSIPKLLLDADPLKLRR